ncbi:hypothetical protein [Leptothoe kymatousa]|uniref:Uncharacterized protein n=1 Tax=Leptothoe kymatousa TAU-MAC 1615 TaxID=2364775 RepID=A0ABS5XZH1_9CYAN|nr:hypothetical protein [Leptothoe kymatousa]MBT9310989.1 hypothetical protein [Leptothoe kymatousa TAU-MAC 1615]
MKIRRWGWIGCAIALSACGLNQTAQDTAARPDTSSTATPVAVESEPSRCAPMAQQVPLRPATENELPFEQFDFRPTTVTETEDTLTFAGNRYSFTFCKRDRTWGIDTVAPRRQTEEDYDAYYENLSNPEYAPINQPGGDTYEARVRLDAAWLDNPNNAENNLEQVVFELIKPGTTQPSSTVLYTNGDIIERELGASAGVPHVSRALATADSLWWAIGFEQGEGASGITTLVQYQPATDEIKVWQPTALNSTQINDLAITGNGHNATLWLGTQYSGEGNPYLPAQGLVAYQPAQNATATHTVENSPLVGAIPTRLWTVDQQLWVASGSGICEIDGAAANNNEAWTCWQFTTMADTPAGQALYPSLLADTPTEQTDQAAPAEILWVADQEVTTIDNILRYEVKYAPGITTTVDQGADYYAGPDDNPEDGYFWWPGRDWSWNGHRFTRHWDQVALNYVGGGPNGISAGDDANYVADWLTMRGDFELVSITEDSTELTYYSAWVDAEDLAPWVTVTPVEPPQPSDDPNPTDDILAELKQATK